jgi:hypothetical protein
MQGALGYFWPHGQCNKHFAIVSKEVHFLEEEASLTQTIYVFNCGNFLF